MTRYRYDPDMDCLVPIMDRRNDVDAPPSGPMIIKDIDGYRTIAGDVAHEGKRVHIGSRSRHREFLRDNGYVEVGNDFDRGQVNEGLPRRETKAEFQAKRRSRVEAIKMAIDLVRTGRVNERFDTQRRDD
jgi:hypothetical protein